MERGGRRDADGLTLSEDGVLSGTPTEDGTFTFTVKAENDAGSNTKELSIEIGLTPPAGKVRTALQADAYGHWRRTHRMKHGERRPAAFKCRRPFRYPDSERHVQLHRKSGKRCGLRHESPDPYHTLKLKRRRLQVRRRVGQYSTPPAIVDSSGQTAEALAAINTAPTTNGYVNTAAVSATAALGFVSDTTANLDRLPLISTIAVLAALVILVVVMNLRAPLTYTVYNSNTIDYEKGTVTDILEEKLEPAPGMPGWELGSQKITVRLNSGTQKGQEVQLDNNLSTTHNIYVKPGQSVIVKADRPKGITPYYTLYNYDRTPGLCAAAAIFVLLMLLVGRFKGLKSVLGLCVSLFFILGFLLPTIYHGYSPVLMSALTVIVIAAFCLLLLNGFSRKTFTAVVATAAGVILSALFFLLLSVLLHLSGYNVAEAEELIVISQNTSLQIGQVLFASVLISSLGAVMDMTMSIASSLHEMKEVQPNLSGSAVFRSGLTIGQDMIGTMCQTLILAFVGSSLSTLLVLVSYGTRFDQFMSSDYVAVEVVHAIAGRLAVIFSVPVTAGLCALSGSPIEQNKQTK